MKKLDYKDVSTEILMSILQTKLAIHRNIDPMEDVTVIRNIIKQRRMDTIRELQKLLDAEARAQRLVTHYLKGKK